jgi:chemotaxis protein CheX
MATDLQSMEQIVSNVFDAMLMMPTSPIVAEVAAGDCPRVVAAIKISGAVNELVVVEAPLVTAALIAETMFDAGPGSLQQDEIDDAVGEVVNMIGGNVKGMYPGESKLSLPCVSHEIGKTDLCDSASLWTNVAGLPLLTRWQEMAASSCLVDVGSELTDSAHA